MMKHSLLVGVGLLAVVASGCAHPQASVVDAGPALEVPMPPPRLVQADPVETPVTVEATSPIPSASEAIRAGATPAGRGGSTATTARPADSPRPDSSATEAKPPDDSKPAPLPLQTAPSQKEAEVEASIKAILSRAGTTLSRIDYQRLTADARTQYDQANAFRRQAEDQMKSRNLMLAQTLAEKADAIAAQLAPR